MPTAPSTIRILGIDPGLRSTGFGLIEQSGSTLVYLASGSIESRENDPLPLRLATIAEGIGTVIARYQPQEAAIERVFVNANPQATLKLGEARGAAIAALVATGLPVAEYTALQIKQAVVGHGKAAKQQVAHMVMRLLALPDEPSRDAADALACAICHAHARSAIGMAASRPFRMRKGRLLL